MLLTLVLATVAAFGSGRTAQLLPAAGDGDIRAVYWELQNQTDVWLTLEPRDAGGARAPLLTFTYRFAGKRPEGPPTHIDVRAYAPPLWAGRATLWFLLDGREKIDLGSSPGGLIGGVPSDYLLQTIPIEMFKRFASAKRISGEALGSDFELTESQRLAVRAFLEQVLSDNPARQPR